MSLSRTVRLNLESVYILDKIWYVLVYLVDNWKSLPRFSHLPIYLAEQ